MGKHRHGTGLGLSVGRNDPRNNSRKMSTLGAQTHHTTDVLELFVCSLVCHFSRMLPKSVERPRMVAQVLGVGSGWALGRHAHLRCAKISPTTWMEKARIGAGHNTTSSGRQACLRGISRGACASKGSWHRQIFHIRCGKADLVLMSNPRKLGRSWDLCELERMITNKKCKSFGKSNEKTHSYIVTHLMPTLCFIFVLQYELHSMCTQIPTSSLTFSVF